MLHSPECSSFEVTVSYLRWLGIIVLTCASLGIALGDDSAQTRQKVEKAQTTYQSESEKLRTSVKEAMEKQVEIARKSGNKTALDVLNKEISQFESGGPIPSFLPEAYHKKQIVMLQRLENALDAAVKEYTKKGNDSDADSVAKELKSIRDVLQFIEVRRMIVGTWKLKAGSFEAEVAFSGDGTAHTSTNHDCSWAFNADKQVLTWTYPHGLKESVNLPIDTRGTKGMSSRGVKFVITKK